MNEHARFLLALSPDPRGDVHRLVYADWLEEQGHPLAELLRLQVEIAGRRQGDPEVPALHGREKAILSEHEWCFEALCAGLGDGSEAERKLDEDVLGLSRRDPVALVCPECTGTLTPEFSRRDPRIIHWKINPGLAFNELVLGTRLLRDTLYCDVCRYYCVRCPACRRFPNAHNLIRGVADWLGARCPACGAGLPMLNNFVTAGVLGLGKLAVRGLSRLVRRPSRR
jgi:uncharacterized protein (TIGR02996 family)